MYARNCIALPIAATPEGPGRHDTYSLFLNTLVMLLSCAVLACFVYRGM